MLSFLQVSQESHGVSMESIVSHLTTLSNDYNTLETISSSFNGYSTESAHQYLDTFTALYTRYGYNKVEYSVEGVTEIATKVWNAILKLWEKFKQLFQDYNKVREDAINSAIEAVKKNKREYYVLSGRELANFAVNPDKNTVVSEDEFFKMLELTKDMVSGLKTPKDSIDNYLSVLDTNGQQNESELFKFISNLTGVSSSKGTFGPYIGFNYLEVDIEANKKFDLKFVKKNALVVDGSLKLDSNKTLNYLSDIKDALRKHTDKVSSLSTKELKSIVESKLPNGANPAHAINVLMLVSGSTLQPINRELLHLSKVIKKSALSSEDDSNVNW